MTDDEFVVLDYGGHRLPGSWPTEQEAIEEGLCRKYLLSGYEVVPEASQTASKEPTND